LIENYGLFWKRDDVFWGRQKVKGRLEGVPAGSLTSKPVDFRGQQGVYVLYDDGFRVVYVGQSGTKKQRLFARLKRHTRNHLAQRWTRFSWFGVRKVRKTGELAKENYAAHPLLPRVLNHIEAILIAATEPPQNRQSGKFGADVKQYIQYRDKEAAGLTVEETVKKIKSMVEKIQGRESS